MGAVNNPGYRCRPRFLALQGRPGRIPIGIKLRNLPNPLILAPFSPGTPGEKGWG